MHFEMIVACTKTGIIGSNNTIPWYVPADLKHFKKLTENNIIVMGRKTFESLPILKNRIHVIITKQSNYETNGAVIANMENIFEKLKELKKSEIQKGKEGRIFIIGGGEIYLLFFDFCKTLHLTIINKNIIGDTFFPLYKIKEYKEPEEGEYHFMTYQLHPTNHIKD